MAVISRLRIRGASNDPLAAKLQASRLLGGVELCPTGISQSAVVCIRKLSDPLPGSLALDQRSLHPPRAWQQSVNAAIERLIRRAVRPLREAVPANAECVLFADRAELLACLAIDWCECRVGMRWWWRSLLPGLDGSRSILPFWLEAPEYIPGAWLHLANRGRSEEFAGKMNADEARDMLRAVTRRFALDDLQAVVDAAPPGPANNVAARDSYRALQSTTEPPSAPWELSAPESGNIALGVEQRCLLGVALTLQRAPAVARTRGFAHAARRWAEAAKNESLREGITALRETFDQTLANANAPEYELRRSVRRAESQRIGVSFEDGKVGGSEARPGVESLRGRRAVPGGAEQPRDSETFESDFSINESEGARVVSCLPSPAPDNSGLAPEDELNAERLARHPAAEASSERQPEFRETAPLLEALINTNFGGLFYLLNFGLYLELYGDITTPSVRDVPVGVWDFLALVGERLVGSELRGDPVWALMARLAGRDETQEPGGDCAMPESWRAPAQWMKPFDPDGVWRWEANDDRLRVWHPARFVALDLPLEPGDPARQLRREMEAFAQFTPKIGRFRKEPNSYSGAVKESQSSLQRWLDWLMPYTRARLRLALGLAENDDVGRALCGYRARVFVTATHMDVMFSLEELLVEIRLAGLDRDPGWIPATGRIIRFHFE